MVYENMVLIIRFIYCFIYFSILTFSYHFYNPISIHSLKSIFYNPNIFPIHLIFLFILKYYHLNNLLILIFLNLFIFAFLNLYLHVIDEETNLYDLLLIQLVVE